MTSVLFSYRFHAIGQGLFASGNIRNRITTRYYNWIFDCGTKSKMLFLDRELDLFTKGPSVPSIGLLCLSHFDEDHINGAKKILAEKRIDILVLPYIPLVSRMLIALSTPSPSDDFIRFLVDPVSYLRASSNNIGQILLIAGGPPPDGDEPNAENDGSPPESWDVQIPPSKHSDPPIDPDLYQPGDAVAGDTLGASVCDHGKPLTVGELWEFMFYNEYKSTTELIGLRPAVVEAIRTHRKADGTFMGSDLLKELKKIFTKQFGKTSAAKNSISLVVYTGPIKPDPTKRLAGFGLIPATLPAGALCVGHRKHLDQPSALYTGDYFLTTLPRLEHMRSHFGMRRWKRVGVLQVPIMERSALGSWELRRSFSTVSAYSQQNINLSIIPPNLLSMT